MQITLSVSLICSFTSQSPCSCRGVLASLTVYYNCITFVSEHAYTHARAHARAYAHIFRHEKMGTVSVLILNVLIKS